MTDPQADPSQEPAVLAARVQALEALVAEQAAVIAELRAENQRLRARVAELERRLRADSATSSKPPSSDGLRKPLRPARPREPGKRSPGKQPGAPGAALMQVAEPDQRRVHVPLVCRGCGAGLLGAAVVGVVRRQVHDLPEVRVHVTEYQAQRRVCGCGQTTTASFPAGVGALACSGPGLGRWGLPAGRAAPAGGPGGELLGEVLGVPVAAGGLAGLGARVRALLVAAPVVHADETLARVAGRGHWVHSASTDRFTWQSVHPSAGVAGIDADGVLGGYRGVVVHDDWAPYWRCAQAEHAL